jgi:L-lactate dehydrogenase complex protein LldG
VSVRALSGLAAAFAERAASVGTRTHVTSRADAVALVEALLAAERAPVIGIDADTRGHLPELVPALAGMGRTVLPPDAPPTSLAQAAAGVSWAAFGVGETGSVALANPAPADRLVSMLPPLHLVVLRERDVLPDLDAAAERLRAWTAGAARQPYVSLITCASRTSDIERVLTIGVHGPRAQHVLLLADE